MRHILSPAVRPTRRGAPGGQNGRMLPVALQDSVLRFARSLEVPQRLASLHPRTPGNAGNFNALPPAVVLGVISAFEGFVEDFLATALFLRGYGLAQIARRVSMNNPTVADFRRRSANEFPGIAARLAG